MLTILHNWDQCIFYWINSHHAVWGDYIAYWFSHRLFWLPLYIYIVLLLKKLFKKDTWRILLLITFLIIFCDQLSSTLIKPYVKRLRPCEEPGFTHLVHIVGTYTGSYGFVSAHATNSFGLAMLLWLLLRTYYKHSYLIFVWAGCVSYSRVYGGVHYLGDILIGGFIGLLLAWIMYKLYLSWLVRG